MRILSDRGNEGGWYQAAIAVEIERNWGQGPEFYQLYAMNVQHSLATLGHNIAMAAGAWEAGGDPNSP